MNNNKKKIIIALGILILLMVISTPIIKSFIPNNITEIENFNEENNAKVFYKINSITYNKTLTQNIDFFGYSIITNNRSNKDSYSQVYLISKNHKYKVKTYTTLDFLTKKYQKLNIRGFTYGYSVSFNGIHLKNGEYNIYIERIEDNETRGIVKTDTVIVKNGSDVKFKRRLYPSNTITINAPNNKKFEYEFKELKKDGNNINFEGWVVADNDTVDNVYLAFKDKNNNKKYYTTEKIGDIYTAVKYSNFNLIPSGFMADIDFNEIIDYDLYGIVIKKDNQFYEQEINHDYYNTFNKLKNSIQIQIQNTKTVESDFIKSDIYQKYDKNKLLVYGWAFMKEPNINDEVYIGIKFSKNKELYYTTNKIKRKDIVNYFKNENLINSGFYSSIEFKDKDIKKVSSIVIKRNNQFFKIDVNAQDVSKSTDSPYRSEKININPEDIVDGEDIIQYHIDRNINNDDLLDIYGWAFIKNQQNARFDRYVGIIGIDGKETYYTTKTFYSKDVVRYFNNNYYGTVRFNANIARPINSLYRINSIVIYDGKKYYYKKINDNNMVSKKYSPYYEISPTAIQKDNHIYYTYNDNCLNINGWILDNNSFNSLFIELKKGNKKLYYTLYTYDRNDINMYYGKDLGKNIGIRGKIILDDIKQYEISNIIIYANNTYYSVKPEKNMTQISKDNIENISNAINIDKKLIIEEHNYKYHIDNYGIYNNRFMIKGWAFILDQNSENNKIYLGVKNYNGQNYYYETKKIKRSDVANHFNNDKYENIGFIANIDMIKEPIIVESILIYDGKNYRKIKLKSTDIVFEYLSERILLDQNKQLATENTENKIFYNKNNEKLYINGWILLDNKDSYDILIELINNNSESKHYKLSLYDREDIYKYLNKSQKKYIGFKGIINIPEKETNKIVNLIVFDKIKNEFHRVNPYVVEIKNTNTDIDKSNFISEIVDIDKKFIVEENNIKYNIDKNNILNNLYNISGWAFLSQENKELPILLGVKINHGKEIFYTTEKVRRIDVAKKFKNNKYEYTGFIANINLVDKQPEINSILIKDGNRYYKIKIDNLKSEDLEFESKEININKSNISDNEKNIKYHIDKYLIQDNVLEITGWGIIENKDNTNYIRYVGLKNKDGIEKFYTMKTNKSQDVCNFFDSSNYKDVRFKAHIIGDNVADYKLNSLIIFDGINYYYKKINIK